jgi:hypothetical protein
VSLELQHRFAHLGQPLLFVWERDVAGRERARHFAGRDEARHFLEVIAVTAGIARLRSVLRASLHFGDTHRLADDEVLEQLARYLADRRLIVVRGGPDPDQGKNKGKGQGPPSKPPPITEVTFIEIELVDQRGRPVPNERYRITLPSGDIRTGNLDKNGFARVDGIRPGGICDIEFPDIHKTEWRPA